LGRVLAALRLCDANERFWGGRADSWATGDSFFLNHVYISFINFGDYSTFVTRTPGKKRKIQSSPYNLIPVFLAAAGRSVELEADLLPGEETQFFFVAVLSSISYLTYTMNAEQPDRRIASPRNAEYDASKNDQNPNSSDDKSP
jgi:hypothetical protein